MRVLMVTSSYPKFPGDSTAPFIEAMARGVAGRGHVVDVVLPHHPDLRRGAEEHVRFLPYRYAPREAWNRWGYAQSLEADVRVRPGVYLLAPLAALALRAAVGGALLARRYDVAHVHWVVPNAALVADILRAHAVPTVVSLHGSDVFLAERSRIAGALARRALRSADVVTACSGDLLRRAVALGSEAGRGRLVPYGVDTEAFAPGPALPGIRTGLGVPEGALFLFGVGRLVEKKGFSNLVEAVARTPGVHLVLAGMGDLHAALRRQADALGASVSFAGGLDRGGVAAALAAADLVAVPSIVDRSGNVDGLPNALLEALAAGRPVVASRVGGIPEVVEDGVNGLLVPPGDTGALAGALSRLAGDPGLRQRLGRGARRTAEEHLGWDKVVDTLEECYARATALDAR